MISATAPASIYWYHCSSSTSRGLFPVWACTFGFSHICVNTSQPEISVRLDLTHVFVPGDLYLGVPTSRMGIGSPEPW